MQTPQLWGDMRSRMSREAHVWICEGLGGEVPPGYSTGGRGRKTPGYPIGQIVPERERKPICLNNC